MKEIIETKGASVNSRMVQTNSIDFLEDLFFI